jgi:hypothetical protein
VVPFVTMLKQILWFFRTFWISTILSILAIVWAIAALGFNIWWVLLVLIAIEITFSFDNAVVNAKKLVHMSRFWQTLFLTVGIFIAIFGMRVFFPIAIVVFTAGLGWGEVVDLAFNNPEVYAQKLEVAHPTISSFGGAFLLMLVLHFFFDHKKEINWLQWLEKPAIRIGMWWVPPAIATAVILLVAAIPANAHSEETIKAGFIGIGTYVAIHGLTWLLSKRVPETKDNSVAKLTGLAALSMFVYLEILDASFSFDGVLGAFAITNEVILIAVGLGIGAVWVRSLTVFMVRYGVLDSYKFLEHGAHYAIGILAIAMLGSLLYHVPEVITGTIGIGFICASAYASIRSRNARQSET